MKKFADQFNMNEGVHSLVKKVAEELIEEALENDLYNSVDEMDDKDIKKYAKAKNIEDADDDYYDAKTSLQEEVSDVLRALLKKL